MADIQLLRETLRHERQIRKQKLRTFDASFSSSSLTNRKIWDGEEASPCDRYHFSRDTVSLAVIDPPKPQDFLNPLFFSPLQGFLADRLVAWVNSSEDGLDQRRWFHKKLCPEILALDVTTGLDKLVDLFFEKSLVGDWVLGQASHSQNTARSHLTRLVKFILADTLPALNYFPWHCLSVFPHQISQCCQLKH